MSQYAGKLKTQLYWWLSKARPFFINDEYKIELLFIDRDHLSAKLLITNLKTGETQTQDASECDAFSEACTDSTCHTA